MGTAIVGLVVLLIVAGAIYMMVKDKKKGKTWGSCNCGCGVNPKEDNTEK